VKTGTGFAMGFKQFGEQVGERRARLVSVAHFGTIQVVSTKAAPTAFDLK
jgi:hypothetical protein